MQKLKMGYREKKRDEVCVGGREQERDFNTIKTTCEINQPSGSQ